MNEVIRQVMAELTKEWMKTHLQNGNAWGALVMFGLHCGLSIKK